MRKVLFASVALVMLLSLFVGNAVAAEPKRIDQLIQAQLGEVWGFYFGGYLPFERVDAYMYRPIDPGWLAVRRCRRSSGTWWWTIGDVRGPPAVVPRLAVCRHVRLLLYHVHAAP